LPDDSTPHLTEPQRRHLEILFAILEEWLADIDQLASEPPRSASVLTLDIADLPSGFAPASRVALVTIRNLIRELAERLALEPRRESRMGKVRALVATAVVRVEDSYAAGLKGYGRVDPRLAEVLNPVLDRMKTALLTMGRALYPRGDGSNGAEGED
jgi:hypothetical protein